MVAFRCGSGPVRGAAGRLRSGSAPGLDMLPPGLFKFGGLRCATMLGNIVSASFAKGVPQAWRGGRMAPVPKNAKVRGGFETHGGVLCFSIADKLFGQVSSFPHHAVAETLSWRQPAGCLARLGHTRAFDGHLALLCSRQSIEDIFWCGSWT